MYKTFKVVVKENKILKQKRMVQKKTKLNNETWF